MPEDKMVAAGAYRLKKQFRNETYRRRDKDMPWQKKILDLDKKKVFGRTARAWCRIIGYYLFLYSLIAVILIFWYAVFHFLILEKGRPLWLKNAPGMSVFPTNETTVSYYSNLMSEIVPLVSNIDDMLHKLKDDAVEYFSYCNDDELWGFAAGKPCFFIKLNYVYGFTASTYETVSELPKNAPTELEEHVQKFGGVKRIWLTCKTTQGPSPKIEYIPGPYYTVAHPMKGTQRVIAVQLNELTPNTEVFITCKAWARNIPVDLQFNGKGHVKFSILMHEVSKPLLDPVEPITEETSPPKGIKPERQEDFNPNFDLPDIPRPDLEPQEEVANVPSEPPKEPPPRAGEDLPPTEPPS